VLSWITIQNYREQGHEEIEKFSNEENDYENDMPRGTCKLVLKKLKIINTMNRIHDNTMMTSTFGRRRLVFKSLVNSHEEAKEALISK
jgi:hypothetical protein